MKYFFILFFFVLASSNHLLSSFDPHFQALSKAHAKEQTSHAFSIAMKIFVQVQTLYEELSIKEPIFLSATPDTCEELLS